MSISPEIVYTTKTIVILLIALGTAYILKNFVARYPLTIKKSTWIEILEIRYISRNKGLMLVRVRNCMLLLAFDESGVHKLKEWHNEHSDISTMDINSTPERKFTNHTEHNPKTNKL